MTNIFRSGRQHRPIFLLAATVVSSIVLLVISPASSASAETTDGAASTFEAFVDGLGLETSAQNELKDRFEALTPKEQVDLLRRPEALLTFGKPTIEGDATSTQTMMAAAAVTTRGVTNKQPVQVLGLTVGTFTSRYTFQATSRNVTRNLECTGWWSGFGLAGTSSASNYISSGRGTCNVRHQMSYLLKGSPIQFNKLQSIVTVAGDPRRAIATIRTV